MAYSLDFIQNMSNTVFYQCSVSLPSVFYIESTLHCLSDHDDDKYIYNRSLYICQSTQTSSNRCLRKSQISLFVYCSSNCLLVSCDWMSHWPDSLLSTVRISLLATLDSTVMCVQSILFFGFFFFEFLFTDVSKDVSVTRGMTCW